MSKDLEKQNTAIASIQGRVMHKIIDLQKKKKK